jgi:hypothetical protein
MNYFNLYLIHCIHKNRKWEYAYQRIQNNNKWEYEIYAPHIFVHNFSIKAAQWMVDVSLKLDIKFH